MVIKFINSIMGHVIPVKETRQFLVEFISDVIKELLGLRVALLCLLQFLVRHLLLHLQSLERKKNNNAELSKRPLGRHCTLPQALSFAGRSPQLYALSSEYVPGGGHR